MFAAYNGESYADIPTVQRTVGFIPRATREERVAPHQGGQRFRRGARRAEHRLPHRLRARRRPTIRTTSRCGKPCAASAITPRRHQQTFALETGQEPAEVLLSFFQDVNRPNLRINFDPANMILYGTGDPIEALKLLAPHVVSVHCKDGDWPPKDVPGALGTERPLGQGSVGIERFVQTLREIGFKGSLNIEREAENQEERIRDMRAAVGYLRRLTGQAGAPA